MAAATTQHDDKKVLIIGAGIAGLVLAQILRKEKIPFEIFDRDETLEGRTQGWSISLAESIPHLESLLPTDIGPLEPLGATYAAGLLDEVVLWDNANDRALDKYGGVPKGHPGYVLRPYRPRFRQYLAQKIDIRTDKKFTHYTESIENGETTIEAHFADGTSARGTILVGADGARSPVRAQLLGAEASQTQLSENQMVLSGAITLSKAQYAEFRKVTTCSVACPGEGMFYFIGTNEARADGTADIFVGVCGQSEDPVAEASRIATMTPGEQIEEGKMLCERAGIPWSLRHYLEGLDEKKLSSIVLTEYSPPDSLPLGRVTIIGDAAHNMVPLKGAGANTAILDACDLGRLLSEHCNSDTPFEDMLKQYEIVALPRGQAQVSASRQAGRDHENFTEILLKGRHSTIDSHVAIV